MRYCISSSCLEITIGVVLLYHTLFAVLLSKLHRSTQIKLFNATWNGFSRDELILPFHLVKKMNKFELQFGICFTLCATPKFIDCGSYLLSLSRHEERQTALHYLPCRLTTKVAYNLARNGYM